MRVPIHQNDLIPGHGFKRIAKKLQREWPGLNPIQLSRAREILSKGLGYCDYHDVVKASKKWQHEAFFPSKEAVNFGLMLAISAAIRADNPFMTSPLNILAFVRSLPMHTLIALKGLQKEKTHKSPTLEPSPSLLKSLGAVAFLNTEIGFCSASIPEKAVEKYMRCCSCSNYFSNNCAAPHINRPTSS